MLKIYALPVSLYCAKLRILLRHKMLEWREELPPGGYGSEEYRALVPAGSLPAMVDGNLLLMDSEAIGEYLNEKYPNPPMLPEKLIARGKVREQSRFHDTRLEPAVRAIFTDLTPAGLVADVLEARTLRINRHLEDLVRLLPERIPELTLADCGYPITSIWINALAEKYNLAITWPKEVLQYLEGCESFPTVKAELDDYKPKVQAWMDAK